MAGKSKKRISEIRPGGARTYKVAVEEQHRIRLPAEAEHVMGWLLSADTPGYCLARRNADGGIVVDLKWRDLERIRQELDRLDGEFPPHLEAKIRALERQVSMTWTINITREKSQYALALSEELRRTAYVPEESQDAIVVASPRFMEIWREDEWDRHITDGARDFHDRAKATLRDIRDFTE